MREGVRARLHRRRGRGRELAFRVQKDALPQVRPTAPAVCRPARPSAGALAGYRATAYPAVGPDIALAGGEYVEVPVDEAVVDRNLVTSPAWPGDTAICREFARLMGATFSV